MSDVSCNASCKSPRASPTPLLIHPPQSQGELPGKAVGAEEVLDEVKIEVNAKVEYHVSSPELPTSPQSTLTIVQAFTKEGLADDVTQHLARTAVDKVLKWAADQKDTINKL